MHPKVKQLNISMDVYPRVLEPGQGNDYIELSIQRLLYEPLIIKQNNLLSLIDVKNNRAQVKINPNLKWPDGKSITSEDYVNGFNKFQKNVLAGRPYFGIKYLECINNDTVGVNYQFKNTQLLQSLLSDTIFSPYRESYKFSGPYTLVRKTEEQIILERNPHHYLVSSIPFEQITLQYVPQAHIVARKFNEGKLDITCPSQFDIDQYKIKTHNIIHWKLPLMACFEIGKSIPEDFVHMAKTYQFTGQIDCLVPSTQILPSLPKAETNLDNFPPHFFSFSTTIFYSDFFPNYNIALDFSNWLKQRGTNANLQKVDYWELLDKRKHCDNGIVFQILGPKHRNPFFYYFPLVKHLNQKVKRTVAQILSAYINTNNEETIA